MPPLRFYDFFAGAGLVELALAPTWTCVWANDIDARKAAIHAANFDHDIYHLGDVAEVTVDQLPVPADMAWASFPCQDLSLAGWRRGMSARRSGTFWSFWRIMRDLYDRGERPPLIVIENVAGLLYGDNFGGLCEALAGLDMQFGALLIDAHRFVPQSRPRVFVVAVDARLNFSPMIEDNPESSPWFTKRIWSAHVDLPDALKAHWRWWRLPSPEGKVAHGESLIEQEPTYVTWHTSQETERLLALMSPVNRAKVEHARQQPGRSIGFLYKRTRAGGQRAEVRFDGVAGCLRTPYGGSSRQTVVVIQDGLVRSRLLSPREAARLMGVPDAFHLPANYNAAYRAMGDGVAAPAVSWLSEHLLAPLSGLSRETRHGAISLNGNAKSHRASAEMLAERWLAEA